MVPQPTIPSVMKLRLIQKMASNGGIVTFKTQNVYKCNRSFKRAMHDLHDRKLVLIRQCPRGNEYKLSYNGMVLGKILNGFKD